MLLDTRPGQIFQLQEYRASPLGVCDEATPATDPGTLCLSPRCLEACILTGAVSYIFPVDEDKCVFSNLTILCLKRLIADIELLSY